MIRLLAAGSVFIVVFGLAFAVLNAVIKGGKPDARRVLGLVPVALTDLSDTVWLFFLIGISALIFWAVVSALQPVVRRYCPHLAAWIWSWLPETEVERARWEDASPRRRVTVGPTRLELVKGLRPGQQPRPTVVNGGFAERKR